MQVQELEWLRHFPWVSPDMISEHRGKNDPWTTGYFPAHSPPKRMWTQMERWFNRLVKMLCMWEPQVQSLAPKIYSFFPAPEQALLDGGPWALLDMAAPKPNKNNNKRIWTFCFHFIYFLLLFPAIHRVNPGTTLRNFSWQSLGDHKGYGGMGGRLNLSQLDARQGRYRCSNSKNIDSIILKYLDLLTLDPNGWFPASTSLTKISKKVIIERIYGSQLYLQIWLNTITSKSYKHLCCVVHRKKNQGTCRHGVKCSNEFMCVYFWGLRPLCWTWVQQSW